jgi:hypothetical protein
MDFKASGKCSKIVTINARRTTWCDVVWLILSITTQHFCQNICYRKTFKYIPGIVQKIRLYLCITDCRNMPYGDKLLILYQEIVLFITFNLNAEIFIIVLTVQQMINRHCLICPNSKLSSNVFFSKLLYGIRTHGSFTVLLVNAFHGIAII